MDEKLVQDYAYTRTIIDAENVHTIEWLRQNSPFSVNIFRKFWAHYRRDPNRWKSFNTGSIQYSQYVTAVDELTPDEKTWYANANLENIFNIFLSHDKNYEGPLFLAFCLENGDEIILQRVLQINDATGEIYQKAFRIIFAEYSKDVTFDKHSRNQLPKDDDVEKITIMTNMVIK